MAAVDFEKMQGDIAELKALVNRLLSVGFGGNDKPTQAKEFEAPMTVQEASLFLSVPVKTLYQKKNIPRHRKGKRVFYFKSELIKYIKEKE